jgi:hypothetical protein
MLLATHIMLHLVIIIYAYLYMFASSLSFPMSVAHLLVY